MRLCTFAVALVAAANAAAPVWGLELISRQDVSDGSAQGNGLSVRPSVNSDGSLVTFDSRATNLIPGGGGDANLTRLDVFVLDRTTGALELVSRQDVNDGGAQGNQDSFNGEISADGRFVAFTSASTNLIPGGGADVNSFRWDIFLFDRQTANLELISRQSAADGGAQAEFDSDDPSISADGRYVAFESSARNLIPGGGTDVNSLVTDVFVFDRQTQSIELISRRSAADGGAQALGGGRNPAISADGRYVAFDSRSTDLIPGGGADVNGGFDDVFLFDRQTGSLELISRQTAADGGGQAIGGGSVAPSVSADGRFVAFQSRATNLIPGGGPDANPSEDIFVLDRQNGSLELISRQNPADGGAQGNNASLDPQISADGRFVAFTSLANNLLPGGGPDGNGSDVFRFDRQTGTLELISRQDAADGGAIANNPSFDPAVTGDGSVVAFASEANNLLPGGAPDANPSAADVFIAGIGGPAVVADAGTDQVVNEGVLGVQLDGSGGNGAVNYSWTQLAGPAVGLIPNNQVVNPSFDAPFVSANKTLTFELIVDDGAGSFSDPDTVDVSVVNTNTPPVADAGDDATVKEGAETILDGSHSFDPEGGPLGYQWMQTTGPLVVLQPSSMVASPSFTAPFGVGNQLTFELVVDDGKEFGASDEVIVTVVANSIPTADAGPDHTVDEGTLVNLDGTLSSDLDGGDTLTFEWTGPAALSDSTSPTPSFTAPFVGSGGEALEFTLIVTDDDAVSPKSSAPDHVTINVRNLSDPPSCDLARAYCPESSIAPDGCTLWPPNHKLLTVGIVGIADPDSDDNHVTVQITGVTQDEPLTDGGAGSTSPDAVIQDGDPADSVLIRAERSGQGDGRVYVVHFTADDGFDSCNGSVTIGVPHDRKDIPVDTGQIYDSTQP